MKNVYCRNSSPWEIHAHPMDTGTWKFFVKVKQHAYTHIDIEQITNGSATVKDITNATDTWLWTPSLLEKFTCQSTWNISRSPSPKFNLAAVVWCHCITPRCHATYYGHLRTDFSSGIG